MTLPTVEQAQEFLRVINVGREAIGLERLEKLEFDEATRNDPMACLSATNLFNARDGLELFTGSEAIMARKLHDPLTEPARKLAAALGKPIIHPEERRSDAREGFEIPGSIRVVTDPFDTKEPGLFERLREAGVV